MSKTELGAAKHAAKAFGIPLQELRRTRTASRSPEPRKCRYVFWLDSSKMWVVVRRGLSSKGMTAADQTSAAKLAATAIGCRVADAFRAKTSTARPHARHFKFVVWENGSMKWRARLKGFDCQPRYTIKASAAKAASPMFRIPLATLRLKQPQKALLRESRGILRIRYMMLMALHGTDNADHPTVPGDLADLLRRPLLRRIPGLLVPFIVAKYGPHRDALADAMRHASSAATKALDNEELLHAALVGSLGQLSGQCLASAWRRNVGRTNAHHGGLVRYAHATLKLLLPAKRRSNLQGLVHLGLSKRPFRLAPLSDALRQRLATVNVFGEALASSKAPTTMSEWATEVARLQSALRGATKVTGFTEPRSYRSLWVIRCWLIWLMRRSGIPRLKLTAKDTVHHFAKAFPDQRCWIHRLAGRGHEHTPMQEVFKLCDYCAPPEYFSMFACLFGDRDLVVSLQRLPPGWLSTNKDALLKAPRQTFDSHRRSAPHIQTPCSAPPTHSPHV